MRQETPVAIMIVAADLKRERGTGKIMLGQDSVNACDKGLELASRICGSHIVITAGNAGPKWHQTWMAVLMKDHIISRNDSITPFVEKASVFTTNGEMESLAYYVRNRPIIREVVLVVKRCQAPRAKFLCDYQFYLFGIKDVEVKVVHSSPRITLWHFVWELGAWPKNLLLSSRRRT